MLLLQQDWHRYGQHFWSVSVIVSMAIIPFHSFNGNLSWDRLTKKVQNVNLDVKIGSGDKSAWGGGSLHERELRFPPQWTTLVSLFAVEKYLCKTCVVC